MQLAQYKHEIIDLSTVPRSRWHHLYIESTKKQIRCIHCQLPVSMDIPIDAPPTFIHDGDASICELKIKQIHKEPMTEIKDQTIRLPQRRSIQSNHDDISNWKKAEYLTTFPPFHQRENKTNSTPPAVIELDDEQQQAVMTTEGPLLILAGAGSGKTRVLTARAAHMLRTISPKKIILVTFTAKAALEMKERMASYPGIGKQTLHQLMIGTFHSIFYKMLVHHDPIRWHSNHLLKEEWRRRMIVTEAGRQIELDEKEFAFDQALTQISWWKNHMLTPEQVEPSDLFEERCLFLYEQYVQYCTEHQLFDFDDMLLGTYQMLHNNEPLLEKYQERFSYVSIDEFQDINKVQMEIILLLTKKSRHVCVVGDDDQSIYSFRGSDPNYILSFKNYFPEAKTIILKQNYRSSHEITSAANHLIQKNKKRFPKEIEAQFSNHEQAPLIFYPYDEEEEATIIALHIKKQLAKGKAANDIAILFRTNASARALVERLISMDIPFQISRDYDSFYERHTVKKVLAFLSLAIDPNDESVLPHIVQALFLKRDSSKQIRYLTIEEDCSLIEAFQKLDGLKSFQKEKFKKLPKQFKLLKKMTPFEAIHFLEEEMGLKDMIKKQGNEGNMMERGSDDLNDLKVIAKQFSSIADFLLYIERVNSTLADLKQNTQNHEGVQLLTIHRAKGLEYNTVYLIGATEGGIPHEYALEALRERQYAPLEEERRLMYVAMTRAIDQLYLSAPQHRRNKKAERSRFIREVEQLIATTTNEQMSK